MAATQLTQLLLPDAGSTQVLGPVGRKDDARDRCIAASYRQLDALDARVASLDDRTQGMWHDEIATRRRRLSRIARAGSRP